VTAFADLVTAATVGLAQRPLTVTGLAGPADAHAAVLADDPAVAVLDAAALLDAARRAGAVPAPAPALPAPAPEDTGPELSPTASELLRDVLARGDRELLADLLATAAAAGVRVAAPDLPALLGLAATSRRMRPAVAALLGERGRWLAGQHPDWRVVVDTTAPAVRPDAWEVGRLPERVAWLRDLRERDPAAARATLAEAWRRETGDDRAALLAVLATGLSTEDEPFLDAALDDRKAEVREQARALLGRLPTSGFVARAVERARDVLRPAGGRRGARFAVTAPASPGAVALRDGLTDRSPHASVSGSAWRVYQVIARAPLSLWTERFGAAPAALVARAPGSEYGAEVLAGWRAAALREEDAEWAAALLTEAVEHPLAAPDDRLAALLPAPDRIARAVAVLAGARPGTIADVAICPAPWPAELTDAALGYFGAQLRSSAPPPPGDLPHLVARRVDLADRRDVPGWLRELADRFRGRTAAVPGAGRWAAPLERAAATLDLRRRFARELP
jgi:hypothetical protein